MRRAEVRTPHRDAASIADAVRPDNTPEMTTRADAATVVTTIERGTTAGLRATLDDYLVNLAVADRTRRAADRHDAMATRTARDTEPDTDTTDDPTDTNQTDTS